MMKLNPNMYRARTSIEVKFRLRKTLMQRVFAREPVDNGKYFPFLSQMRSQTLSQRYRTYLKG